MVFVASLLLVAILSIAMAMFWISDPKLIVGPIVTRVGNTQSPEQRGDVFAQTDDQYALGAYLSQDCVSCHRKGAGDVGIPDITGRPADEFISLIMEFKSGNRVNPAMVSVVKSLDDEQISALAGYFSRQ